MQEKGLTLPKFGKILPNFHYFCTIYAILLHLRFIFIPHFCGLFSSSNIRLWTFYNKLQVWQSVCTSLNKNAVTHSNLLRFKNVSAACIMCTTECTEYYKTKTKTAVHQCFVCLFLWVEGWYLLPEACLFEQCSTYDFT